MVNTFTAIKEMSMKSRERQCVNALVRLGGQINCVKYKLGRWVAVDVFYLVRAESWKKKKKNHGQ